jgi:ABC-type multidrug transport system fused ATPase/permease subunit
VYVYATAGDISASIIFSSIVAFDMLRLPLMFYPNALAQYAQAKVSLRRVATFLGSSEVNTMGYTRNMDSKGEIIVDNATLYWYDPNEPLPRSVLNSDDTVSEKSSKSNKSQRRLSTTAEKKKSSSRKLLPTVVEDEEEMVYPKPVLNNVNIHVSTGELCAIVGPVGSGKSTLCSAILNEAVLGKDSHICLTGSVAYVSQTAWILNRTVRENILFGRVYDESRYDRVIDACCLRHDLRILEDGDSTEIGERGINLSGGQKQRVSLARAAYADADVYIFDDPLSALDPEVAEIVFDECILGMLRSKTRLLVTNQLQFLSKCDSIIALGAHGHVLEQGTYSDLMTNSDGEVTRLLKNVVPSRRSSIEGKRVKDGSVGAAPAASPAKENKKLISNEERQTGTVKFDVYLKYIKAGGGYVLFSAIFFFYLLSTGSSIGSSVWISVWTADSGMGYEKHSE